jgi:choline dehydrogenase-like flavoprotein
MPERLRARSRRTAVALAESLLPAYGSLAAGDETTVARAEALLAGFGPQVLRGYGALLFALEQGARISSGRSFSSLPRADRETLIARWSDGALPARLLALALNVPLKVAYFDDEAIYEQKRAQWRFTNTFERPRWMSQVTRGGDVTDDELECDVVVAGTGAGGAVIAKELSDRGLAVLMLEEGDYHTRADFTGDTADAFRSFYQAQAQLGSIGNTVIPIPAGRMVGGSTAINTGTCWRTPEWVLDEWAREIPDLAPANMGQYFDRVEKQLQVEAASQPALGMVANVIARGADALGWSHRPLNRNAPACDGSGICDLGCPTDARRSTNISYVPPALENGAMLLTGVRAQRVLLDDGARAIGFEARALATGRTIRIRARATVLACGTLLTPVVLQRQGLHKGLPHVGRNLSIHPATTVSALFDEEIRGYAAIPQGYCVDQFHREGILMMGASAPIDLAPAQYAFTGRKLMEIMDAYERVANFGVMVEDAGNGRVRPGMFGRPLITYRLGRDERRRLRDGVGALCRIFLAAGAREVYPALHGHRVLRSLSDVERLDASTPRAIDWLLTAFHPLGTCRMAGSPKRGVVSPSHEVFGVPGLYIADGSVVPSAAAVNPQVTIMAMATRAADLLAERLAAARAA